MGFRDDHPDFEAYAHPEFEMASIPEDLVHSVCGLVLRLHREREVSLKAICHDLAARIPTEPTENWGADFLISDLKGYLWQLSKNLPKFLDFLGYLAQEFFRDGELDELNEILHEKGLGYLLVFDATGQLNWRCRDDEAVRTASIAAAVEVPGVCQSALEHLDQAKENLKRSAESDRARKDAVRDCMSAMEAVLKTLASKDDIKDATKELRTQGKWGPDEIVKDGISSWDRLHQLYPDLRHGQPAGSAMTEEEALYWIDRITAFVRYLSRRNQ